MRYKAFIIQGYRSLYTGSLVLARQGNDFVDAKELAGISNRDHPAYKFVVSSNVVMNNLKNCEELNDGVYFLKHKVGDIFILPESNQFFTTGVIINGLDADPIYLQVRVKVLVIKYLNSLNS